MNGLQTDSNGIETLVAPPTGEGGQAINENFAALSALISSANALIAELQAAVAALTTAQAANAVLAGPSSGSPALPAFRALTASDIPTLNQNTTGTAANVTGTVALANGGTGQTTQQAAIDALTDVSGATDEYVLTKDTSTGHALFKAASVVAPGGSAGQLQFNSSGVFAGDTATTDGSGNLGNVNSIAGVGSGAISVGSAFSMQGNNLNMNTGGGNGGGTLSIDDGSITNCNSLTVSSNISVVFGSNSISLTPTGINMNGQDISNCPSFDTAGTAAAAVAAAASNYDAAGTAAAQAVITLADATAEIAALTLATLLTQSGISAGISTTLNWLDGDGVTNHSLTIVGGIITAAS